MSQEVTGSSSAYVPDFGTTDMAGTDLDGIEGLLKNLVSSTIMCMYMNER